MKKDDKKEFNEKDYEFMNSLSAAMLGRSSAKISRVIKIWLFTIIAALVWASYAEIDEITRGEGDVIPDGENQVIQNLEGGILDSIVVKEGDVVSEGDIILRISNSTSTSTALTNEMKLHELQSKQIRLYAEAHGKKFKTVDTPYSDYKKQLKLDKQLYDANKLEFKAKDDAAVNIIAQKKQAYKEAKARIRTLKKSLEFVAQEVAMTAPMVREGVKSKVDFLKLKREANGIENDIESARLSLPRLNQEVAEYRNKRKESKQLFINKAKEQLNEVTAEIARLEANQTNFSDQLSRTMVRSPVNGIVQKLYVHTVGGVIKPGADLIEIVPLSKKLLFEIKIKPSDIAFLHPGAEARVKLSAYDYAIHGGLVGTIVHISPDTITDAQDNTFYIIHVESKKSHLGTKKNPLKIIPGMMASVDIITGKKTVMQYILKPILKSKQYVFSER